MVEKNNIYQFELLKHVEETPRLNNRMAAAKLGCSVKLAHELLSKMVDKGLFHVKKHHTRRWDYFLTPKGIAEKARLTYEFLDFSMTFYREARKKSSQLCKELAEKGIKKITFIGAGDLAEIVYLGVKEWGLELESVYANTEKENFMGIKISSYNQLNNSTTQHILVCLYDKTNPANKTKFLPEELQGIIHNSIPNIQNLTTLHWIF